jgi:hypothetical protein
MSDPLSLGPDDPAATARRINDLRNRVLAGEQVAPEEYAEIIAAVRADRQRASTPQARKAKVAAVAFVPDALFS